jgi:hypothetical protein
VKYLYSDINEYLRRWVEVFRVAARAAFHLNHNDGFVETF